MHARADFVPVRTLAVARLGLKTGADKFFFVFRTGLVAVDDVQLPTNPRGLIRYTGPFELPEPDADIRAIVQRIVDNGVNHVPVR